MTDHAAHSPSPLNVADCVELAVLERSGMIESRHVGAAVVTRADGTELRAWGNVDVPIYPRSSLKPLQAIAVRRSGLTLEGERLALATASHTGTARHVAVVREILDSAGLDEAALQCPVDWPSDVESAFAAREAGLGKRRIAMNCSGKHAAFLAACVQNDWPLESYLDPAHPLQRLVRQTIEEFAGETVAHTGVDGCGAPLFAITLRGLATAIARVAGSPAKDPSSHAAQLVRAVLANPWAIDGPGEPDTVIIERLGLFAKAGAEGVMVLGAPDGTAVALKILDGSRRAGFLVALHILASVGAVDASFASDVARELTAPVLGGGVPVGELRLANGILP
ncbi:asparaginase [Parafrigoribacterium soli]|uniref:asparaginase n=1 Tax=Parafrigoribacterium soli TaxID=3144663 RepID=UPI0032ED2DA6